jgi:hypothetical protein
MRGLKIFFSVVLLFMVAITTWASLEKGMTWGYSYLFSERWGIATLADAACGFLTFYTWVFYKERSLLSRLVWLVLILFFGNIAMSIYALNQLRKLPPTAGAREFLLHRSA